MNFPGKGAQRVDSEDSEAETHGPVTTSLEALRVIFRGGGGSGELQYKKEHRENIKNFLYFFFFFVLGGFLIIRVYRVNPRKLETGLRTIRVGIPSPLPFRIEAIGFPTFELLLKSCRGFHKDSGRFGNA